MSSKRFKKAPANFNAKKNGYARIPVKHFRDFAFKVKDYYVDKYNFINNPYLLIKWPKNDDDTDDRLYYITWPNYIIIDFENIFTLSADVAFENYDNGYVRDPFMSMKYLLALNILIGLYELNDGGTYNSLKEKQLIHIRNASVSISNDAKNLGIELSKNYDNEFEYTPIINITLKDVLLNFINSVNPTINNFARKYMITYGDIVIAIHTVDYSQEISIKIPSNDLYKQPEDPMEERIELHKFNEFIHDNNIFGIDSDHKYFDRVESCNFQERKFNIVLN